MNADCYTGGITLHETEKPEMAYGKQVVNVLLIVDDSLLIIEHIKELIEDVSGISSIYSCCTYAEAIKLISVYKPAAVLLDIDLPGRNGIILLKYIKALYTETKIIVVTNQIEGFYKNLCLELGASYFLDKSNDFEKLPELVASVFHNES